MRVSFRHLTALTLCTSLIGCAQLTPLAPDASPAERMTYATSNHLLHEHSYNFDINLKVDELTLVDAEKSAHVHDAEADAQYPELAELSNSLSQKLMSGKKIIMGLNIDASGAVDMRRGKLEVIPAVRFEIPNASAKAKLPMLLDLSQNSFYIDPAAITNSLPELSWLQPYQQPAGTFYRINLAEPKALADLKAIGKEIPIQHFLQIYVDSYAKAVANMPPERIQMVAVDDWGKSIHATQQINAILSLEEYLDYTSVLEQHLLEGSIAYFKKYQGKALPAHLVKAIQDIDLDAQQVSRALATSLLTELLPKDSQLSTDTQQLAIKQSLYLDGNNRLVGQSDGAKLNLDAFKLDINSRTHLSNFGRPTWQINTKKAKVIDADVTLLTDQAWATLISAGAEASSADDEEESLIDTDSVDAAAWAEPAVAVIE
ncbi:hypothetical protein AB8Q18_10760 [Neisseriaceae bacterium CLB008]